jgi:hypothetical protein
MLCFLLCRDSFAGAFTPTYLLPTRLERACLFAPSGPLHISNNLDPPGRASRLESPTRMNHHGQDALQFCGADHGALVISREIAGLWRHLEKPCRTRGSRSRCAFSHMVGLWKPLGKWSPSADCGCAGGGTADRAESPIFLTFHFRMKWRLSTLMSTMPRQSDSAGSGIIPITLAGRISPADTSATHPSSSRQERPIASMSTCPVCNLVFSRKEHLIRHQRARTCWTPLCPCLESH